MDAVPSIASIGALVGSPARANILTALFDGRALTATELSHTAGVSAATTSVHLEKLVSAGLLICEKHGRHRYYRLAGTHVAEALEPLFHLVKNRPVPARDHASATLALREARLCYDHLAGRVAVLITAAMED
ncbi:MAG: ArsR/SmtB family transcription factor, partial [Methyloligellaceae bacterium]